MSCPKCPFLEKLSPEQDAKMKKLLQRNYDTNYMDCRTMWPDWKPGLCHRGKAVCAGYKPNEEKV